MIPEAVTLGPVTFHLYGLLLGLALIAGGSVAAWMGSKHGVEKDRVWQGLVWVGIAAVIGARVYHVVDLWDVYIADPVSMVYVWNGGLGIFGALLGGVVGLGLYVWYLCRGKEGECWRQWLKMGLDVAAFGLPVGQAIGRLGNWVNQELYGMPTSLPWAIRIDAGKRLVGYELHETYHPLFLYEGLLSLGLFGSLVWLERRGALPWGRGGYMAVYLMGYGVIRFLLEPMRITKWQVGGVPTASLFSVLIIGIGIIWLYRVRRTDA